MATKSHPKRILNHFFKVILILQFVLFIQDECIAQYEEIHKKAWEFYNASEMDSAFYYFSLVDSLGFATNDSILITDATIFLSGYASLSNNEQEARKIVERGYPYIVDTVNKIDVLVSMTHLINNKTPFADSIYNELMTLVEQAPDDILFKTTAYNNYALYALKQGELATAALNYQKAIESSLNDFTKYSTYISGINVFELMGNDQMVDQYYQKAKEIGKLNNYKSGNGKLSIYKSKYLLRIGDLEGSKKELVEAIKFKPKLGAKDHYGELVMTAKKYYSATADWESLEELLQELRPELEKNDILETGFYQNVLGTIAYNKGDLANAEKYGKKAVEIADKIDHRIKLRDAHELLGQIYKKQNKYELALDHQQTAEKLTEEIFRNRQAQNVIYLGAVFEKQQQDLQIKVLNHENEVKQERIYAQNRRLIIGSLALALFTFLSLLLWRLYKKVSSQKSVISKALKDKDILLREIHHRVKNNLQLVSSLLTLQGRSIDDATAQQAINEGKSRVRSMALIHQDLYNGNNLSTINVQNYLEKLTSEIFTTYRVERENVKLNMNIEEIDLDIDTIVPLGLIINELITNSLKYAFPEERKGELYVGLSQKNKKLILDVNDDGIGYEIDQTSDNSFGTTLISALTEQLSGVLSRKSRNGTQVTIEFDLPTVN